MENRKKAAGFLTFEFFMAWFTPLFARFGLNMRNTAGPLYIQDLGFGKSAAGFATSAYTIAALVFRPIVGRIIDKFGRMKTVILGNILSSAALFMLSVSTDLSLIYILCILCGIGFSFQSTALSTVMTDLVPDEHLSEGLGYFSLTTTVAQAVSPVITLSLISGAGYKLTFITAGAVIVASILAALNVRYEKKKPSVSSVAEKEEKACETSEKLPWWASIVEPSALKAGALISFVYISYSSINTFMATYGKELGLADSIGLFFTVNAIFTGLARLFTGKITDRIGNTNALRLSLLLLMISFFGIPFAKNITVLCILSAFQAVGNGLCNITCNVLAVLSTPKERRGAANATFYLLMDIGLGLGAALWGIVADILGTVSVYWGSAVLVTLIFAYTLLIMKGKKAEA